MSGAAPPVLSVLSLFEVLVADIYMYADETGDLAMTGSAGSSRYFGFGTAVFSGDHGHEIWEGLRLRCELERLGVHLPRGLHAKNDSRSTRGQVFNLIAQQTPRFDTTFLLKERAYPSVRRAGEMYLYKLAWYLHFKEIALQATRPGDTLYVIAATLGTRKKASTAKQALDEVCRQVAVNRVIQLCVWDAPSAWGIQVADYGLWAVQREMEAGDCEWYRKCIQPTLRSEFTPWGRAPRRK